MPSMKHPVIEHLVWDWNGTLLDDAAACVQALNRMLARRRLPAVGLDEYLDVFDFPVQDYYVKLGFDFSREDWDRNANEFHNHYDELVVACGLRDGVIDLLQHWAARGMPMSILSASEQGRLERTLSEWGIRDYFCHIIGLDNVYATSKVQQGRRLMEELGLSPSSVLLIGDTTHDHDVASTLGCRCLLLTGGHHAEHRLRACGCPVVHGMDDLFDLDTHVFPAQSTASTARY